MDVFRPYKLPYNHRFLSDHIEIKRSVNEHISEVKAKDYWALKHFLGKARDDVHELFRKLFQDLLSPNKAVYVDSESWTRITEHQVVSKDEEQNRIFFLTLLRPNLFQDAILLGANIGKSMVHDWLSRYHRYQFVEEADIAQNLRPLPDNLGQRLEIRHFGFDKLFSKWQRDKPSEDGGSVLSKMEEQVIAEFGQEPFLFTLNNDRDDKRLLEAGGTRIPAIAHGLNEFQAYRNVFFGAALNREPKHNRMLLDLGFSSRCIQQSALEVTYQATMRSALRDFGSAETVRVVVPDMRAAEYLQAMIGPCKVQQIGNLAPVKRLKRLTQAREGPGADGRRRTGRSCSPRKLYQVHLLMNPVVFLPPVGKATCLSTS